MDCKRLIHKIVSFTVLHRYDIQQHAAAVNIYAGQPPILQYLLKNGVSAQKDIADAMHVSPASIAVSIKRMEKNGLVSKTNDEGDMRKNKIMITETGEKTLADFDNICREYDSKIFSGITEDELKIFEDIIDRLSENLMSGRDCSDIEKAFKSIAEHGKIKEED